MRIIGVMILLLLAGSSAIAQDNMTAITYSMGYPTQDTRDWISEYSWRGIGLEGRRLLKQDGHFSLGLSFAWNVFNERTTETISIRNDEAINGDITGTQRRYLNAFPFMATGHLYFGSQDDPQFYLGGGAGVFYIIQRFELGVYAVEEKNWHLGVAPEVGFIFPAGNAKLLISAKYNYAFAAGETISGQEIDWTYLGINVGLAYWDW